MKNTGIEDIAIDNTNSYSNKNRKKALLYFFIFLLIILAALFYLYNKYYKKTVTTKQLFFQGLLGSKIEKVADMGIYDSILNRLLTENSKISNNITFLSSNEENSSEEYDFRKFSFDFTTNTNIERNKYYSEFGVNYSDNELIKFNILSNNDKTAIYSNDIVKKYVGMNNNAIKDYFGINYNKNFLKDLKNNKIDIPDEEKNNYKQKYFDIISNSIPEEKFSVIDNYALEKNGQTVNVITYTVKLTQEELKNTLSTVLTELKNDKDLLNKLVSNTSNFEIEVRPSDNTTNSEVRVINPNENSNENIQNQENNNNNEVQEGAVENNEQQENLSPEFIIASSILPDGSEVNFEEPNTENKFLEINTENIDFNVDVENFNRYIYIINLLFGNKINNSIDNIETEISNLLENINNLEGNGITVNVYVSDNGTEKISAILPNDSSLDIEFNKQTDDETNISFIYLYSGENSEFDFSDKNVKVLSTSDEIKTGDGEERNNGIKLEYNKTNKDARTWVNVTCNFIEDKKINKKISASIETKGNNNSKTITNEVILTYNGEEENKVIIENSIDFGEVNNIEDFTDDNSIFIDELNENEYKNVLNALINQANKVYEDKKRELLLIDSNTQKYTLKQNLDNITVSYEEAKNALVEKVSNLMWEAQEKNEEFTIQNLKNLQIDGYNVSSTVTGDVAKIVVDVYSFTIDSNFTLTDSN